MKTIRLSFVALAALVLGTFVFIACSDEGNTVTPENSTLNLKITDANTFISDFYGTSSWVTGRTIITTDTTYTYSVAEIIVSSDTRARGYLVKDNAKEICCILQMWTGQAMF